MWLLNNNGKHAWYSLNISDVPTVTPRAFGAYYRKCAPYVFGAYASNSAERFLYSALNYYVFCKVGWDPSIDTDAVIDEYYDLMFGRAAGKMRQTFDMLERKWLTEIIGRSYEIKYGTSIEVPRNFTVWTKLYSPARIRSFEDLFDAAAREVEPGSIEARRLALMRREILDPLVARSRRYASSVSAAEERKRRSLRKMDNLISGADAGAVIVANVEMNNPFKAIKYPVDVKPGRTYRLSFFATGRDIVRFPRVRRNGAQAIVWFDQSRDKVLAETEMVDGTFGDVHLSVTFTVPADAGSDAGFRPELDMRLFCSSGEFDSHLFVLTYELN